MSDEPNRPATEPDRPQRNVIQSHIDEGDVRCPSCGHVDQVTMWEVLEATCNPERAAQLASGQLLVHACPQCGALVPLDYPLFYLDRDRKQAAYYPAGQGDLAAIATAFTQAVSRFHGIELSQLRKREFAMRVVPERHQLAEKVTAWRAGLDDELLEVFKASLLRELQGRNPDLNLCDLQLTGVSGGTGNAGDPDAKLDFVLFSQAEDADGKPEAVPANAGISLPVEAYRRLGRSLDVRQQIDLHRSPVVDAAWAQRVLAAVEQR